VDSAVRPFGRHPDATFAGCLDALAKRFGPQGGDADRGRLSSTSWTPPSRLASGSAARSSRRWAA